MLDNAASSVSDLFNQMELVSTEKLMSNNKKLSAVVTPTSSMD